MQTEHKLPTDLTKEAWHVYLTMLVKKPEANTWIPEDISTRLQVWRKRFDAYSQLEDKSFRSFNNWRKKNKFKREGEKLQKALIALEELHGHPEHETMHKLTKGIVDVQLTKLEISQLHLLSKAQNLRRKLNGIPLEDKKTKLEEFRKGLAREIESGENYSTKAHNAKLRYTSKFFLFHQKKVHFTKHFRRLDKASDTINVFSAINNLLANIAKVSAPLFSALQVVGAVLQAVPFINSIVYASAILIHAAKMWLQNKSLTKRAFAAILVGVVVGGLITMGLATVAAAAVAVGLMTIGTYVKHIHPWARYLNGIRKKNSELTELAQTKTKLASLISNSDKFTQEKNRLSKDELTQLKKVIIDDEKSILGKRERQFLMVKAEEAFIRHGDLKKLHAVQQLILNGTFSDLNSSEHIKELTKDDLKKFLFREMNQREEDLKAEIKLLSALEKRKRGNVIAGVIAITGAILLCIPTPVTWILGASLLLTSAVIGVSLSFDLPTKIKNLGSKIFSRQKTEPDTSEKETLLHKPEPENKKSLKNSTAQLPFKPTIELSRPPVEEKTSTPLPQSTKEPSSVPPNPTSKNENKNEDENEGEKEKPHP